MVVEDIEDGEEDGEERSGSERCPRGIRSVLSMRSQVQNIAAVLEAEGGLENVEEQEEVDHGASAEEDEGDANGGSPAAAATVGGESTPAFALSASELLAAAAAAGLVPRPGSGCHLTGGGRALQLLHVDTISFSIRHGELGTAAWGCAGVGCLPQGKNLLYFLLPLHCPRFTLHHVACLQVVPPMLSTSTGCSHMRSAVGCSAVPSACWKSRSSCLQRRRLLVSCHQSART